MPPNHLLSSVIDKLTNSIQNTISGDSFPTIVQPLAKADLRNITKKNGWQFAWVAESKLTDRQVYKLTIEHNPHIIQGLASLSDYADHYYLHLVESAPFNLGKKKLYEGVPGNLFAFACKTAWDQGYEGIVAFQSKTKLLAHYETMLGATHIGGHKMIIFPHAALKLIRRYFSSYASMAHIKEPAGVDLLVAPAPLTAQDQQLISEAIAAYKRTRKLPVKSQMPRSPASSATV